MERVESCTDLKGCDNIWKYARRLNEKNISKWETEERLKAIAEFALLTIQMKK